MKRPFVVANWKMNLTPSESCALLADLLPLLSESESGSLHDRVEIAVCPTFTALYPVQARLQGSPVGLGAQDVYWEDKGAYTGEVSACELHELQCRISLVGHSERRHLLRESDADCARKCEALLKHGIRPLLCVGETEAERASGATQAVITRQLQGALSGIATPRAGASRAGDIDIAYEPVWAIGTGKTASPEDAQAVHIFIRSELVRLFGESGKEIRILYGGSVTVETASSLIQADEIYGFLVGGASLKAQTFAKIIEIVAKFRQ